RAIIDARRKCRINNTGDLATIIRSAVPRSRVHPIDPATRTFQAIRIWVNNELEELQAGLEAAAEVLKIGGKILVTSFHSLTAYSSVIIYLAHAYGGYTEHRRPYLRMTYHCEQHVSALPYSQRRRSGQIFPPNSRAGDFQAIIYHLTHY
ncbi:16S rRNA (cytosine(1402)-N(4))-methyltransferase, partial [Anaplasma marginale]|uniref:16S rRNA (cytosine(1402)-N(4))-methyltransferase n=1 Tax=Anaplasma marginale TaxID=770 RepID=UPI0030B8B132